MDIRENAKTHFKGLREGELGKIHVPEWSGEEPAYIYFKKAMRLKEREMISKELDSNGTMSAVALTLVLRALTESGQRIFRNIEKVDVMNEYDSKVVLRIVEEMNSDEDDSVEDAEKN